MKVRVGEPVVPPRAPPALRSSRLTVSVGGDRTEASQEPHAKQAELCNGVTITCVSCLSAQESLREPNLVNEDSTEVFFCEGNVSLFGLRGVLRF